MSKLNESSKKYVLTCITTIKLVLKLLPFAKNASFTQINLESHAQEALDMIKRMYDLFLKKDALLIEVNPYAEDAITGQC